ncbi:MAG: hypothetical protein LBF93_09590 [Zoogloeaceae bacterium]|nr:hypothetical protein [Zoogloeaceae bacterium]
MAQELARADGGPVRGLRRPERRFAVGGMVKVRGGGPYRLGGLSGSGGSYKPQKTSFGDALGAFATPIVTTMAANALKPYISDAVTGITDSVKSVFSGSTPASSTPAAADASALTGPNTTSAAIADAGATETTGNLGTTALADGYAVPLVGSDTAGALTGAANTTGTVGAELASTSLATEALTGAAANSGMASLIGSGATGALGAAGGVTGGAAAGATTGSAAGPVGAAIGAILGAVIPELFADGGAVRGLKRRDMRRGGEVDGPGGETDDAIPARFSDGEFVLNAEAVRLLGMDTLARLNQIGLELRRGKGAPRGKVASGKVGVKGRRASRGAPRGG